MSRASRGDSTMALREIFARVLSDYPAAYSSASISNPIAQLVRDGLAKEVRRALGPLGQSLVVKGSAGQTNLARVPWCAVLDPAVTETAQAGYYVVYLFAADGSAVSLSLNQGATAVTRDFGGTRSAIASLKSRVGSMKLAIAD